MLVHPFSSIDDLSVMIIFGGFIVWNDDGVMLIRYLKHRLAGHVLQLGELVVTSKSFEARLHNHGRQRLVYAYMAIISPSLSS